MNTNKGTKKHPRMYFEYWKIIRLTTPCQYFHCRQIVIRRRGTVLCLELSGRGTVPCLLCLPHVFMRSLILITIFGTETNISPTRVMIHTVLFPIPANKQKRHIQMNNISHIIESNLNILRRFINLESPPQ